MAASKGPARPGSVRAGAGAILLGVLVLAMPAVLRAQELAHEPRDLVHTQEGALQGVREGGVISFKGIPYAAPPVGRLRWHAPEATVAWSGVRDAGQYGNDCMQNRLLFDKLASSQPLSEDCLYLNVWTPAPVDAAKHLPVLVWFHGGGFVSGSSTAKVTEGNHLAERGAVVVSFNYRLGRFGFFAHPALSEESPDSPVGNYGFMDQIAALQWVQHNIAAFGGDPGNVTIFGESSGGESVNIMMLAPQARGLFQKAIVASGGGRSVWPQLHAGGPSPANSPAAAETVGKAFAVKAGVPGDDVAALRALPASKVLGGISMLDKEKTTFSGPLIDGRLVIGDVAGGFAAGKQARVPYIVGANSNELGFLPSFFLRPMIAEIAPQLGPDMDKIKASYPSKDAFDSYFANDFVFVEPAHFLAGAAAANPAFLYRFSYVAEAKRKSLKGAPHASDVPYVFGNLGLGGEDASDADRAMAQLIGDYWVSFARTGTPTVAGHASWPQYSAQADQLFDFTPEGAAPAVAGAAPLSAIADHFAHSAVVANAAPAAQPAKSADDGACTALRNFKMDGMYVDAAEPMAAGDPLDLGFKGLPPMPMQAAICRVQATLTPTPSSQIQIEVWLPLPSQWNGKFVGTGNGGYAGTFFSPYVFMRSATAKGYASAGTDTGHSAKADGSPVGADWAQGQPEKLKDFGYRANHLNAATAKALIQAYYGRAQQYSVFEGCSDGGREALMEARRFPEDYDGIVAGAPANPWTRLMTQFAWDARASSASPESVLPESKLKVLQDAALKQCDALDGVADGLLEDPRRCKFDPATVQCPAGKEREDCLSAAQVQTARKIYGGPKNPSNGKSFGPGFPPGAEAVQWNQWITGPAADQTRFATEYFRHIVFEKSDWDLASLDFAKDPAIAAQRTADILDSDPDLSAFAKRGGKLILYHGWADAAISPLNTIEYYKGVRARLGPAADRTVRLYMVPGMGHCLGGPGPNAFDMLTPLSRWIEQQTPPQEIRASKYSNDYTDFLGLPTGDPVRTRPLCPYPKTAHWIGKGSSDQAENFICRAD